VTDILLVSLGSTAGLRAADDEFAASLRRGGATVRVARAEPQPDVPTLALTDFLWARAARAAAGRALERGPVDAVIYSTTTAALFWPRPGAIRFDAPAAGNRPGHHGFWQRPLERLRLRQAPLLIAQSVGALAESPAGETPALVVPVPVRASGPATGVRDIAAITYGANPRKKGLDRVLAAWATAHRPGEELVVAGVSSLPADRAGRVSADGVRVVGMVAPDAYRALLRRSRLYVTAPRREDYGVAQLEALADGAVLVTNRAPGPYVALALAERLDSRLVGDDLARAIRLGLDEPRSGYAAAAAAELATMSEAAVDRIVTTDVLPALDAIKWRQSGRLADS
jgi:hypothetical protein